MIEISAHTVASYLVAVERGRRDDALDVSGVETGLRSQPFDELLRELEAFGTNGALAALNEERRWVRTTVPVADLVMDREAPLDSVRFTRFLARQSEEFISFRRFSEFLDSVPRSDFDDDLRRFLPKGEIPEDRRRLVVQRDRVGQPWFVADGYHRGILLMRSGVTRVEVFGSTPRGTSA